MDVMMRRRELMGMQGRLKTVSGPIVTVNDALARNAKSLIVNFAPVQAAGTPSPDNVLPISGWTGVTGYRAGVNLFDPSNLELLVINSSQDTVYGHSFTKAATYSIHAYGTGNTSYLYCRVKYADGTFGNVIYLVGGTTVTYDTVVTLSEGQTLLVYNAQNQTAEVGTQKFIDWQVQVAIANTKPNVFTPYTGTTYPVTFPAMGKNLFDQSTLSDASTYSDVYNYYWYTKPIHLQPNTAYILSPSSSPALTSSPYYVLYLNPSEDDPNYLSGGSNVFRYPVTSGRLKTIQFTTGPTGTIRFGVSDGNKAQSLAEIMSVNWQLELGSTATSYEPYRNAYYGGYVDLVSGVLVATEGHITFDGSQDEAWAVNGTDGFYLNQSLPNGNVTHLIMCDHYKAVANGSTRNMSEGECNMNAAGWALQVFDTSVTTTPDFKAMLAQSPMSVVYELTEPVTYQLTPQTIAMLRGVNNLWADTGDTTVKYWKH